MYKWIFSERLKVSGDEHRRIASGSTGVVICLERGAIDLHMVQLMPLPPHHLLLQQNPEWFTRKVPAYPACPGKKAVKTNVVVVVVFRCFDTVGWVSGRSSSL